MTERPSPYKRLHIWPTMLLGILLFFALTLRIAKQSPPAKLVFQTRNQPKITTQQNLKVAFIGDQGLGENARAVLKLIKDEDADAVIHLGDFDYQDNPTAWDRQIDSILGSNFPYFAVVGNHDVKMWPEYKLLLLQRLARIPEANCTGDLGVAASCTYKDLLIILSGVGTLGNNHEEFIANAISQSNHFWKICAWHKTQSAMQVGDKGNDTGWKVYETCKNFGAIITTAHEHSYHRTVSLTSLQDQIVNPECPDPYDLCVKPGSTFVAVSGLGGHRIREQKRCLPKTYPYGCKNEWATIYSKTQVPNATFGALFITFFENGNPYKARGYFKTIEGKLIDDFKITADFNR